MTTLSLSPVESLWARGFRKPRAGLWRIEEVAVLERRHTRDSRARLGAGALAVLLALAGVAAGQRAGEQAAAPRMETLGRGIVAIRTGPGEAYVGWRLLAEDPADRGFHVYRRANGAVERLSAAPLRESTDFVDRGAPRADDLEYFVRAVDARGSEGPPSAAFRLDGGDPLPYLSIPLEPPAGGETPAGDRYGYVANDASAGDLDGDGEYELVLEWMPSNARDNSQRGFTGPVLLDAYELDGRRLWRIDLGPNVRAGAHYSPFMVYDLDGDDRAEVAVRTADGTRDARGAVLGDAGADHRNDEGYVLRGPEFLTVFDGATGAARETVPFSPERGRVSDWGDSYGNRVDRFLSGIAYLGSAGEDAGQPSLITARGYYTWTILVAWDFRDGKLEPRWRFDTRSSSDTRRPAPGFEDYEGMGNHQLAIGDVDGDGRQEVVYGAIAIDDDGRPLYTTRLGHGDALHVSDLDPGRPGLEVYSPHEEPARYGVHGSEMHDARTGELLWSAPGEGADVGRGVALDVDPRTPGSEAWASRGGLYSSRGERISDRRPPSINFGVWWDADPLRELLDGVRISKWDWETERAVTLLECRECAAGNGTKATPALSADLFGDWREEVVWRRADSRELRIYTTTIPDAPRRVTLMHDPQYRVSVAWQNSGYNQPPHPGFFLGEGEASATTR